ncbi:MAG TPA: hypothetical protein PLJ47_00450 [Candidatus Hydrogenedentes bacterium]|nr:hypothetical protein [Candidatus Hydrogenedentota bacterium]
MARALFLPITSLACIAIGLGGLYGWQVSLVAIGAIIWVDLFAAGRMQTQRSPHEPD